MAELLVRKRQLALKAEAVRGTFETGLDTDATAKDFAEFHVITPSWSPTSLQFDREIVTPTLTPVEQFAPGVTSIELSFAMELAGHVDNDDTANYVEPPIFRILRACGFQTHPVVESTLTSWSAQNNEHFIHGETVDGGTSGASGIVVGDTAEGFAETIYIRDVTSGPFVNGETLTGQTSGRIATIDTLSSFEKYALFPISDTDDANNITLSGIYYIDGKRMKFKGARGNTEFTFVHGNPVRASQTMQGILEAYEDGALLLSPDKPVVKQQLPKANLGTGFGIYDFNGVGGSQYAPIYNSMTISSGNSVVLRENSADSDGWSFASITERAMSSTMNWDEEKDAVYDVQAKHQAGTLIALRWLIGAVTVDEGNIFDFRIPAAQLMELSEGERDQVTIWDANMGLKGGEFPLVGVNTKVLGEDNEFVIINR